MNINGNCLTYKFFDEEGVVNLRGNDNKIEFKGCRVELNVQGNNNHVQMNGCQVVAKVNGNENKFKVDGGKFGIGLQGNQNEVVSDNGASVKNSSINGNGNKLPADCTNSMGDLKIELGAKKSQMTDEERQKNNKCD